MKFRPLLLPLFLTAVLGSVHLLPSAGTVSEAAVKMELPDEAGPWTFKKIPASKEELQALAKDTEFSKAVCLSARPGEFSLEGYRVPDRVDLSIVLSGYDLNNSIHRPERCMPAQGHTILSAEDLMLPLRNGRELTVRRLHSTQRVPVAKEGGDELQLNCITYYFFVGHEQVAHDHLDRTIVDMKDRLLRGVDQRWAYVSASTWYGKLPWIGPEVTVQEADAKLKGFVGELAEEQINWDQIRH